MARRPESEALGTDRAGGEGPKWCLDQVGFNWRGEIRIFREGPASPRREEVLPAHVERLPDGTIRIATPEFIVRLNPGNGCPPVPPVTTCDP